MLQNRGPSVNRLNKSRLNPASKAGDPSLPAKVTQLPKKNLNAPVGETPKTLQLPPRDERLPPLALLIGEQNIKPDERVINLTAGLIEKTMAEFGVPAKVIGYRIGPTVTQFAVEPGFVEKPGPDGTNQRQKVRVAQIRRWRRTWHWRCLLNACGLRRRFRANRMLGLKFQMIVHRSCASGILDSEVSIKPALLYRWHWVKMSQGSRL